MALSPNQVERPAMGEPTPGTRDMQEIERRRRSANPFEGGDDVTIQSGAQIQGRGLGTPDTDTWAGAVQDIQNKMLPTTMGLIGNPNYFDSRYDMVNAAQELVTGNYLGRENMYQNLMAQMGGPRTYSGVGQEALGNLAGLTDPRQLARERQAVAGRTAMAGDQAQNAAMAQARMRTGMGLSPTEVAQMQRARALESQTQMSELQAQQRSQQAQINQALAQEAGKWQTLENQQQLDMANFGIGAWQGPLDLSLIMTPPTAEQQKESVVGLPWVGSAGTNIRPGMRPFGLEAGPWGMFGGEGRNMDWTQSPEEIAARRIWR